MFYIVETEEQLNKVISYGNDEVFIEIIPIDDRIHPRLNKPSLIYFRPLTAKRGFIIAIDHLETLSLSYDLVIASLIAQIPRILTIDKKTLLHYSFPTEAVKGLKMAYKMAPDSPEFPDLTKFDTPAHKFYRSKLRKLSDTNRYIPVSKHYEKYEDFFDTLVTTVPDTQGYAFYNDQATKAFFDIECNGIGIDPEQFDISFNGFQKRFSVENNVIYSSYNLYHNTARPSCIYNGFNFLGLKKDNASRDALVPKNDIFVEFDFKSYQVKLLANLLQYEFVEDNIHEHLMKLYGVEDYKTAKGLTFRYLYGREEAPPDIPFFQEVYGLRDYLWSQYLIQGYINSPFTDRKIFGIDEITQILPYLMQCIETECNVIYMDKLSMLLSRYKSHLVLYSYDAFLFDISLDECPDIIDLIKSILEEDNCKVTLNYGESYGDLILSL